jgi:hypothetical protein
MASKTINILLPSLLLITILPAWFLWAASPANPQSSQSTPGAGGTQPAAATDVTGTWSGTFFSRHSNVPPFTMTVVISPDARGHLIGSSTLNSSCLLGAQLQVMVTGSTVVLAGSDEDGDNITVRGTVDNTGTMLASNYILNGSATGRCETDDGTGNLAKR